MPQTAYQLFPIGHVAVDAKGFFLAIAPEYRAGLKALEGFGHVNVLFWCHLLDTPEHRQNLVCEQPYRDAPDQVGVFATRSPARPNPIATTPTAILHIDHERSEVRIPFIDAEENSPILDLKPYLPCLDRVRQTQLPPWCADWPTCLEESAVFDWSSVFVNAR